MAKNTILIYTDLMEQLEELSMEERGIILTAMIKYQLGEELPKMSKLLKMAFIPIRQGIDRDNASYIIKCEKNRENGKLGGAPKGNQNAKKTTETTERLSKQPKQPDNDNDNDNDNENGNGSGNDNETSQKTQPTKLTSQDLDQIRKVWNLQKCTLDIQGFTEKRIKETEFIVGGDLKRFLQTIASLDSQEYLVEQSQKNMPTEYDWFVQPENYQNVIEGKYLKKYGGGGGSGYTRDW